MALPTIQHDHTACKAKTITVGVLFILSQLWSQTAQCTGFIVQCTVQYYAQSTVALDCIMRQAEKTASGSGLK